jgi:hypothetical protein
MAGGLIDVDYREKTIKADLVEVALTMTVRILVGVEGINGD